MDGTTFQRFMSWVMTFPDPNECWYWTGYRRPPAGYCFFRYLGKQQQVHRLSYEHFIGPIPPGLFVLHHCDIRICINPLHLFLGTQADNNRDAVAKGRHSHASRNQGSRHPNSKLTEEVVLAIRADLRSGAEVARHYGISQPTVTNIRRRKTWRHI